MSKTSGIVGFLYGTACGRAILKTIMDTGADRFAVSFLRSGASRLVIGRYARKNNIIISEKELREFGSFRDFFVRYKADVSFDNEPSHLISPCDGWISVYPISPDSSFEIKGFRYRTQDLLTAGNLAEKYTNGVCVVIRLCASDYHHYCYIDDGWQGKNHFIPGELHSVQPSALERYPVIALNRRSWCILETENFGMVAQTEIGAIIVGGIVNDKENERVRRGEEKGHFELAGSTIVLMFEPGRIQLLPEFAEGTLDNEVRVKQGMCIGTSVDKQTEGQVYSTE